MVIHKKARLTPQQREEIYKKYYSDRKRICDLSREYHVTRPTIYKILERGRKKDFSINKSINKRYRCLKYGIKRLARIEKEIEERLKRQARLYNKDCPGQMIHGDTKRLPLLTGETAQHQREYIFIAIDDYSRELFAAIIPDKTQHSTKRFLEQVIEECAYTIF
jgi:hypothetical protein